MSFGSEARNYGNVRKIDKRRIYVSDIRPSAEELKVAADERQAGRVKRDSDQAERLQRDEQAKRKQVDRARLESTLSKLDLSLSDLQSGDDRLVYEAIRRLVNIPVEESRRAEFVRIALTLKPDAKGELAIAFPRWADADSLDPLLTLLTDPVEFRRDFLNDAILNTTTLDRSPPWLAISTNGPTETEC